MINADNNELHRPLGLSLMGGLYLFFFLLAASTFGNPFPLMGTILVGTWAKTAVFLDSLACLYLFLGILKRQALTWYLLLSYNLFEILNTIMNLRFISIAELEKVIGSPINQKGLTVNNIAAALALLLLSQFIYRQKRHFSNKTKLLF